MMLKEVNSLKIKWYILFDTRVIKDIDGEMLNELQEFGCKLHFMRGEEGDFGHNLINMILDEINEGWIYILDDDNQIHPDFWKEIPDTLLNTDKKAIVFDQRIDYKDFTGQEMRIASPENMRVSGVDSAQYILNRNLISSYRLPKGNYIADSMWAETIYNSDTQSFGFINKELCYYNWFKKEHKAKLPVVLLHSDDNVELKSNKKLWFESEDLEVIHRKEIDDKIINQINPDVILSVNKEFETNNQKHSRIHVSVGKTFPKLGDLAYNVAMLNIIDNDKRGIVSFFTPIYNTGHRLIRLWESIRNQQNSSWEWVIVNDSSDSGNTLKLAEKIASDDSRVKVYDFRGKSKGIIGETKYRAAMLCDGDILAEIDHDDFILPWSVDCLLGAFESFPDAGFAYTDCVEILEDFRTTLQYPEGFCFGYGSYRTENHMGVEMNVNVSPRINPKTIRHIVGVPNHIRAWKRDTYLKLGGHNRRLSIADDYELVVRTFLQTKFIRIVKNCYLQFIYRTPGASNTHELSRADIQRRVRSIQEYYNYSIFKRFEELGVSDWAYLGNQSNPLMVPSRFGDEECGVNYDYFI
jgi:glycosyltransferase involved in cell wall biosynthesis